mmetsp:Transcript_38860/g.122475  ORF Transcript_38860/g.122475 Transcript_38860/m.122475 type:complete len:102 (+) Transcript_38860:3608-3913(+)
MELSGKLHERGEALQEMQLIPSRTHTSQLCLSSSSQFHSRRLQCRSLKTKKTSKVERGGGRATGSAVTCMVRQEEIKSLLERADNTGTAPHYNVILKGSQT